MDRRALPVPSFAPAQDRVAPRTPAEELLAGIWEEVLGAEAIGAGDDFFAAGGHSLLAARAASRASAAFGVDVPVSLIFEAPTPAALAAAIEALRGAGGASEAPPLTPAPAAARERGLPLSFAQERLWFLDRLEPGAATYNIAGGLRLAGSLDVAALAA
ncbi:MAG TPA: phosphopantetheine-binding protein, partial [Thermoanaerobaculia bacterium]|nr:phosphopantetheine-binding protein [Thermoanaerobaculia bacterium]